MAVLTLLLFANGIFLMYLVMRNPRVELPPKIKATMGLRKQIHQEYLDVSWNVTEDQTDEEIIAHVKNMYDLGGYAHELVTREQEDENERKRQSATESGKKLRTA